MRILALLALLQLGAAPRTAGKSHGVIHDSMLEGVTFQEYARDGEDSPIAPGLLQLEPPSLAFGARPLGAAHAERVTLFNRSNATLRLASVSGSTHSFHASFFLSKMVPPGGNTTFSVVFLGRREGATDSHIYLHTSLGTHKYPVSGVSVMSEYRLNPLVGVQLPRNASFSPTIHMHNPHDHPIQITEVYTWGGGVTLELPSGAHDAPQSLWLIAPHTTRAVVRVHYTPRAHHPTPPHTAYIRIKLNGTSEVLVVPVEVGVEREPGAYASPHALDAGLAGTDDPPTQIRVLVGNSGDAWLRLRGAGAAGGAAAACERRGGGAGAGAGAPPVDIALVEHALPPLSPPAHVATLTVYWDRIYASGACYGEVHLTTAERCLTVPYRAHALPGALVYNASSLSFVTSSPDVMMAREFTVRNDFARAVHVTAVEMSDNLKKYFAMSGFAVRSVAAGATEAVFSLRLREFDTSLSLSASVTLLTNVTDYRIPVYLYSGKLDLEWQWPSWVGGGLELGVVGVSSTTTVAGSVANNNPVRVCVEACGADMEGASLQFLGCLRASADEPTPCSCLEPGERGALALSVVAPAREASLRGRAWLRAGGRARLQVAVALRAARGRLAVAPVHMRDCFPGTVCSEPLRLDSSLSFAMRLGNVTPHPPDPRLYHQMGEGESAWHIAAHSSGTHGYVRFQPNLLCQPRCYTAMPFNSTQLEAWLARPGFDEDWLTTDYGHLGTYRQLYSNVTARHATHNFTLRLNTSEICSQLVEGSARWTWPRLWSGDGAAAAGMGLVGVGGRGSYNLTLRNPSASQPLYVHALLAATPMHRVPAGLRAGECERSGCVWSPRAFRVSATYLEDARLVRGGGAPALLLPPGGSARVQITFTPLSAAPHTSLLYIRNNLTVLEAVRLTGQGAFPSFKFGNRKPGSGTPLLFELTEKHLKDCDRDRTRLSAPPNLTVKRSFTARNTGDIAIRVSTFFINGFECEGYGFKVLNCEGFELTPNATHKVDIAFTPDFTLSKIRRTLIMISTLSAPVNYSLVTTVPAHLLAPCGASLSRPPWETYLRNATVSFMICVGLCVLAAGFLESDRILKTAMAAMGRNTIVHPPLDLRSIGQCGKPWEWSDPPDLKDKPKTPAWNEERRMSDEGKLTKYEEVAPPKTKKKLCKKYSSEPASTEITPEKEIPKEKPEEEWREREVANGEASENKSEEDNSTPPSETRDTAQLVPSTESSPKILDLPKKILASLASADASKTKRHTKADRRPATRCEEDASSTATESSNNDETEKEPEPPQRASVERTIAKKSSPSNTKKKCPSQYKDSYEGDGEDEEYDRPNKPTVTPAPYAGLSLKFQRNKDTNTPTPTRQNKQETEKPKQTEPKIEQLEAVPPSKPKTISNKFTNNKKDKVIKKKSDKVYTCTPRADITSPSNGIPSRNSPPVVTVPASRWGENKATFSDVVARSENTFSTIIASKKSEPKHDKPKDIPVFSFERKKEKTPLGPIGSSVFQKSSPTNRTDDNHSSLYHPVLQITDPPAPKNLEDLVKADNNNSFFYFGNDNVRPPEGIPQREVGVIGKPAAPAFPTPIGQTFGQISYSPSILEDYGGMESGRGSVDMKRMEFENAWEPRRDSPGMISAPGIISAPNTTGQGTFTRSVYSGDIGSNYQGLWNMPVTTASSPVGAVGQSVGSIGPSVGSVGQPVGTAGLSLGSVGLSVGSIGQPMGSVGQPVGSIGHPVGSIGQPLGSIGQAVGAVGQPTTMDDNSAHAQWLWGYDRIRPPPGFPPSQQPVARPFDPFQSMSTIWSPGTLDHWSRSENGQQQ